MRNGGTELDDAEAYAINPTSRKQRSANGNTPGLRRPRCAKHAHIPPDVWVEENCPPCEALRKAANASQAERKRAAVQVILDCPQCDELGRLEVVIDGVEQLTPCPRHISWAQAQDGRTA